MRGKPTPLEKAHQALALMAIEPDFKVVSELTKLPVETLRSIKKRGITDPEFVKLHNEQKQRYVMNGWQTAFDLYKALKDKMPGASFRDLAIAFGIVSDKTLAASGENAPTVQINQDNRQVNLIDTTAWAIEDKKRFLADPSYRPHLEGGETPLTPTSSASS